MAINEREIVAARGRLGVEEDTEDEYQLSSLEEQVDGGVITEIRE